ncbi:hypothetical protein ACFV23_29370 [Streptomyces sp. NPDC059627]
MLRRIGLTAGLVALIAALGTSGNALAAAGSSNAAATTAAPSAVPGATSTFTVTATSAANDTITCTVELLWPFVVSDDSYVHTYADTQCTAKTAGLLINIDLVRGETEVSNGSDANQGQRFLDVVPTKKTLCQTGLYTDKANAEIDFPPGYDPPSATTTLVSPTQAIPC